MSTGDIFAEVRAIRKTRVAAVVGVIVFVLLVVVPVVIWDVYTYGWLW